MHVHQSEFIKSAVDAAGWPPDEGRPEIAFCGRSNVGKSTLLNAVLGRKLARVSQTPGRTRLINFFAVTVRPEGGAGPRELLLADLPGFGYARVAKSERATWRPMIQGYLSRRRALRAVVLLCDSRRVLDLKTDPDALREEADLMAWLAGLGRLVVPVMTKADKLAKHERKPAAAALARLLGVAPVIFSAQTREGDAELWRRLAPALAPDAPGDQRSPS